MFGVESWMFLDLLNSQDSRGMQKPVSFLPQPVWSIRLLQTSDLSCYHENWAWKWVAVSFLFGSGIAGALIYPIRVPTFEPDADSFMFEREHVIASLSTMPLMHLSVGIGVVEPLMVLPWLCCLCTWNLIYFLCRLNCVCRLSFSLVRNWFCQFQISVPALPGVHHSRMQGERRA